MINEVLQFLTTVYAYLPGGYIIPMMGAVTGFLYALYRYIRSFKYLYYYYIEHGEVVMWMDSSKSSMEEVIKKYQLNKHYICFGYIGGIVGCIFFPIFGIFTGSIWPVAAVIGILTIPNFVLRHVAKEKRNKVVFKQTLKGKK